MPEHASTERNMAPISPLHSSSSIRQRLQVILLAAGNMDALAQRCGANTQTDYQALERAVHSIDQLLTATPPVISAVTAATNDGKLPIFKAAIAHASPRCATR